MRIKVINRLIRRIIWKLIGSLPESWQGRIIRSFVKVPTEIQKGLVFKIASTSEELEQALKLVHDSYVLQGLIAPSQGQIRMTKYHTSPFTSVIIGKFKNQVVATLSLVQDSPLGLPADSNWDLTIIRNQSHRLAEISALAIHPHWRKRNGGGDLLLLLTKFAYEYCHKYIGVDHYIAVTRPQAGQFYRHLLMFDDLPKQNYTDIYSFVNDPYARGMHLNLKYARKQYRRTFWSKPLGQNLYKFFCEKTFEEFQFPDRKYFKAQDPVLGPSELNYFIHQKSTLSQELKQKEIEVVRHLYHYPEFKTKVFFQNSEDLDLPLRVAPRFPAALKGTLTNVENDLNKKSQQSISIKSVSRFGLVIKISHQISLNQNIECKFKVSTYDSVNVVGKPVWIKPNGDVGIRILFATEVIWDQFITHLENDLRKSLVEDETNNEAQLDESNNNYSVISPFKKVS